MNWSHYYDHSGDAEVANSLLELAQQPSRSVAFRAGALGMVARVMGVVRPADFPADTLGLARHATSENFNTLVDWTAVESFVLAEEAKRQ